jgi:hypothetical protein
MVEVDEILTGDVGHGTEPEVEPQMSDFDPAYLYFLLVHNTPNSRRVLMTEHGDVDISSAQIGNAYITKMMLCNPLHCLVFLFKKEPERAKASL